MRRPFACWLRLFYHICENVTGYSRAVEIGFNKNAADTSCTRNEYTKNVRTNRRKDPAIDEPQLAIGIMELTTSNNVEMSEFIYSRINMVYMAKRTVVNTCRETVASLKGTN